VWFWICAEQVSNVFFRNGLERKMKSQLRGTVRAVVLVLSVCCATAVTAVPAVEAPLAVVNGVTIFSGLMDRTVQANIAQGQKDTPELRAALKQEFIARELMAQEAQKRGLDKLPAAQDALLGLRQNLLIELVLNDEFSKNPVADTELKAEYERQVKALKAAGDLQQFQIYSIVVASEADAKAVQAALKSGQTFDAVAKSKSLDPSKDKGGELGWFLPEQLTPAISNVVVNLSAGAVSAAPIQVGPNWHVVKLAAKRTYQVPGFDESKNLLQSAVVQTRRVAWLKKLSDTAVVK
jgi:peptidyl-prolyl cis-trans isomerase C